MTPPLLEAEQVAEALNVPVRTAYVLMQKMAHVRMGRRIRVAQEALVAYIEACSIAANDQTEATGKSTGRVYKGAGSRPVARTDGRQRPGAGDKSENEPIHFSKQRKAHG